MPYVVVSLPVDSSAIWFSVKNVGSRPAYNVEINISPSLEELSKDGRFKGMADPLLNQSFLPPNYEVKNLVSTTLHANRVNPETEFSLLVTHTLIQITKYIDIHIPSI